MEDGSVLTRQGGSDISVDLATQLKHHQIAKEGAEQMIYVLQGVLYITVVVSGLLLILILLDR